MDKELKQVVLEGDALKKYNELKGKLKIKNESEVLRFAIGFTADRYQ